MNDLTERIRKIRLEKRMKQTEIAHNLGIAQSNYSRLETRSELMTVAQLECFAKVLGVSVVELLTGEPQQVNNSDEINELKEKITALEQDKRNMQSLINHLERQLNLT